ncbi:hypothetical protein HPP05_06855 [Corallococcus exiguus]|uniref:hypothetical protein n=1 Tax=Corallococcus exiguus TaxID=83462 RepID=UPI001494C30A|nr:hypothetical protein [Corallococcus exiguus]NPC69464.1 hypothetical protein [Corallococcus exiguus]
MRGDWSKLRAWGGSQSSAFEELTCQLARLDTPVGHRFVRLDPPDGGVEAFAVDPSGNERAWQAKWFTGPLTPRQWAELDESVRSALNSRQFLTEYIVCLPQNPTAPNYDVKATQRTSRAHKVTKQTRSVASTTRRKARGTLDQWNARVVKWKQWAGKRKVEFVLWGTAEFEERLMRAAAGGRRAFWFDELDVSPTALSRKLDVAVKEAGAKYSPDLHLHVGVAAVIDGASRAASFREKWSARLDELRKATRAIRAVPMGATADGCLDVTHALERVCTEVERFIDKRSDVPDIVLLEQTAARARAGLEAQRVLIEKAKTQGKQASPATSSNISNVIKPGFDFATRDVTQALAALYAVTRSISANTTQADLHRAVVILGPAGIGKTHLLCDAGLVAARVQAPAVLVHGAALTGRTPNTEIMEALGLDGSFERFLGALDAAGEASGQRALLLIDALNESMDAGRHWYDTLPGLVELMKPYRSVALVVSVRDTYEKRVLREDTENHFVVVEHHGFTGIEFDATSRFFEHFRVADPPVPLFRPEFQNPLFLKLYCSALGGRPQSDQRFRARAFGEILDFVVADVEERACRELDLAQATRPVLTALRRIARAMYERGSDLLAYAQAKVLVDELAPPRAGYHSSLFFQLVSAGLLNEVDSVDDDGRTLNRHIGFAYQRFGDYEQAGYVTEALAALPSGEWFGVAPPIRAILDDEDARRSKAGILEALASRLPEELGIELLDIVGEHKIDEVIARAWLMSIQYRRTAALSRARIEPWLNRFLSRERALRMTWDALLFVAADPEHPFNADFLMQHLLPQPVGKRDATWTIVVSPTFRNGGAVDALLSWARVGRKHPGLDSRSALLAATAIAWFLTSPDRAFRDRATQCLTWLLIEQPRASVALLERFRTVNDPYVLERIYCALYGAAMHWSPRERALTEITEQVYESLFSGNSTPPHALLRDYGRGLVELSIVRGCASASVEHARISPPYRSRWPIIKASKEWDGYQWRHDKQMTEREKAFARVHNNVFGFSDFSHKMEAKDNWLSVKRGDPLPRLARDIIKDWEAGLSPSARQAWDAYVDASFIRSFSQGNVRRSPPSTLMRALNDAQSQQLQDVVLPLFQSNKHLAERLPAFDQKLAQSYIFGRILELGWTPEHFHEYETGYATASGHAEEESERCSKKYLWIGWHEFIGYLVDHYRWRKEFDHHDADYQGPWQLYRRDIDPTALSEAPDEVADSWWFPRLELDFEGASDLEWIKDNTRSIPDFESLLHVTGADGKNWYIASGFPNWGWKRDESDTSAGRRQSEFVLYGYVLKKSDVPAFVAWARRQNFFGRWMPEASDATQIYFGEHYWAPAAQQHARSAGWTKGDDGRLPVPVLIAHEKYRWEGDSEQSGRTINADLPSRHLVELLGLKWSRGARWVNEDGELAAFDPSVETGGSGALLLSEAAVRRLDALGYSLVWAILGEKIAMGNTGRTAGWLEISGVYSLKRDFTLRGGFRTVHGEESSQGRTRRAREARSSGGKTVPSRSKKKRTDSRRPKRRSKKGRSTPRS